MNHLLKIPAFSLLLFGAVISCKKGDYTPDIPSLTGITQRSEALINAPWKFKTETIVYSPDLVDNSEGEPCKNDDAYYFMANGEATVVYGSNVCSSYFNEVNGIYANWEFLGNGQVLKMTYNRDMPGNHLAGETEYWTVDYITETKMILKRPVTEPGKAYTVIDTYIRN